MDIEWLAVNSDQELFEGRDRTTNTLRYMATRANLIFGSN
jgi:catalase-peroxidase